MVTLVWSARTPRPEPQFEGKSLSHWAKLTAHPAQYGKELRETGSSIVPYLLAEIERNYEVHDRDTVCRFYQTVRDLSPD